MYRKTSPKTLACALGLLLLIAACAGAQEEAPAEPAPPDARRMARTWELIARYEERMQDVTGLAEELLDLTGEQRQRLEGLRRQQREERTDLLEKLRERYAAKVGETLTAEQRKTYAGVLSTLDELKEEISAARRAFLREIGGDARVDLESPATADPSRLLEISKEKRSQLLKLRLERHQSLGQALSSLPEKETLNDPEAWRNYRERYRKLQEEATRNYEKALKELLTPEQFQKLQKVQAAMDDYRRRVREARRQAYAGVHALLQHTQGED